LGGGIVFVVSTILTFTFMPVQPYLFGSGAEEFKVRRLVEEIWERRGLVLGSGFWAEAATRCESREDVGKKDGKGEAMIKNSMKDSS
jgi:hypothetical protein